MKPHTDQEIRAIALHEAGHAVAFIVLGIDRNFVARVLRQTSRSGRGGYVQFARLTATSAQLQRAKADLNRFRSDPEYRSAIDSYVMDHAVALYAGVAAQFSFTRGWNEERATASGRDRAVLDQIAKDFDREVNMWPVLDAAIDLIDEHWGEVVSVANVLEQRFELTRKEITEIMAAAPAMKNIWREPLWPSQIERRLAEAAGQVPAAAMIVEREL